MTTRNAGSDPRTRRAQAIQMDLRCIAHVDMDAFYVNVELQRRPELRGLPVVVSGTGPRAVVTTASYEARAFGVFSATSAARARRLCPRAVFLPPDFEVYRARSRAVIAILHDLVPRLEVVGLDEAYLDLSRVSEPLERARTVKVAVHERTGLTCSVGVGPNKLVAKIASDAEKPDGFLALDVEEARRRFAGAPPRLLPGIGPKSAARLASAGLLTIAAVAAAHEEDLARCLGSRSGAWLARLARFEDDREVEIWRPAKSESRETTFDSDLHGLPALEPVLDTLTEELCEALARAGRRGRTIGIKIRLHDFSTHTRVRTLPDPTNELEVVRGVARELLRTFAPARPVRLLGVRVAGLDETRPARTAGQLEIAGPPVCASARPGKGGRARLPRPG